MTLSSRGEANDFPLQNQHAIAVAVEAVAFANRFLISPKQKLATGKRTNEHEQGRSRQMEICQKKIDGPELIWRINKKIR